MTVHLRSSVKTIFLILSFFLLASASPFKPALHSETSPVIIEENSPPDEYCQDELLPEDFDENLPPEYLNYKGSDKLTEEVQLLKDEDGKKDSSTVCKPRPFAFLVDNEPPARPQTGLTEADYVYEIVAEEITRFMAICCEHDSTWEIGPIRSCRHYFAELARSFDAIIVHDGASPQCYRWFKTTGHAHLDGTKGDSGFRRAKNRVRWHDLMHSVSRAVEAAKKKKIPITTDISVPFNYRDEALKNGPVKLIEIPYYRKYVVGWRYDPETNTFIRQLNGKDYTEFESGARHHASNVIIHRIKSWVLDKAMRHDMDLSSGGTCEVFLGGHMITGQWERDESTGRIFYNDENGSEIKMNPGNIWIQFVEPSLKVKIEKEVTSSHTDFEEIPLENPAPGESVTGSNKI